MTALMATLTLLLIFYLNFKYGYSQRSDLPQGLHEVRERDYFFIASFALWGVWVGMGLATLMEWAAEWLENRGPDQERSLRLLASVPPVALITHSGHHLTASRGDGTPSPNMTFNNTLTAW